MHFLNATKEKKSRAKNDFILILLNIYFMQPITPQSTHPISQKQQRQIKEQAVYKNFLYLLEKIKAQP